MKKFIKIEKETFNPETGTVEPTEVLQYRVKPLTRFIYVLIWMIRNCTWLLIPIVVTIITCSIVLQHTTMLIIGLMLMFAVFPFLMVLYYRWEEYKDITNLQIFLFNDDYKDIFQWNNKQHDMFHRYWISKDKEKIEVKEVLVNKLCETSLEFLFKDRDLTDAERKQYYKMIKQIVDKLNN